MATMPSSIGGLNYVGNFLAAVMPTPQSVPLCFAFLDNGTGIAPYGSLMYSDGTQWLAVLADQGATSLAVTVANLTTSVNAGLNTKAPLTIADRQYHYGYDTPNQVTPNLTAKTVAASDCVPGSWYEYNNSASGIVTLPDNAITPIPIGSVFEGYQIGTGQFTVVGQNANVSVLPAGVIQSKFQGARIVARKRGTNVWVVNGDLASGAAPVNTVPPSISGGPAAGSVLTRTGGTWVGTPSPTVTGAWYKNGVTTGTTTSTYTTATPGDVGAAFTWVESASSTSGGPVTAISNVITMTSAAAGAPVGSAGTVVVTGSPVVNAVLSVNNGTWTNTPTSYVYAWYSNSVVIAGATANTFTVTTAQAGTNVYATVLATGAGFRPPAPAAHRRSTTRRTSTSRA